MRFIKYHGLGNDFAIFEGGFVGAGEGPPPFSAEEAQRLCERGKGIGADGVMYARQSARAPVFMELTNSDGSIPQMCGNGLRCFVKYAVEELGLDDQPLRVDTNGGVKPCYWTRGPDGKVHSVRVDMGAPSFDPEVIPVLAPEGADPLELAIPASDRTFTAVAVNTGNPHMVIFSGGEPTRDLALRYGPELTVHPMYPQRTNVEFVAQLDSRHLEVTVWERGCGLTMACGTGATASAVAAARLGKAPLGEPIRVTLPGGDLSIVVEPDYRTAWMEGPAVEVYRGTLS